MYILHKAEQKSRAFQRQKAELPNGCFKFLCNKITICCGIITIVRNLTGFRCRVRRNFGTEFSSHGTGYGIVNFHDIDAVGILLIT